MTRTRIPNVKWRIDEEPSGNGFRITRETRHGGAWRRQIIGSASPTREHAQARLKALRYGYRP